MSVQSVGKLLQAGYAKREEWRRQYPHVDSLPAEDQRRLWSEYCGVEPTPPPRCLTCQDAGWVMPPPREEERTGYREAQAVLCPDCAGQTWGPERQQLLRRASGVPPGHQELRFADFLPLPGTQSALEAAYHLALSDSDYRLVLIYGGVGNGKTMLAYAAVNYAISQGQAAHCWYVPELLAEWRRRMAETGQADEFLQHIQGLDFLALDDLGVEQGTPAQQTVLEALINYRYAHELPLLATTNRDPRQLGQPVLSRFQDRRLSRMVANTGQDYRVTPGP